MRPTTPNYNFAGPAGQASPPQTPTTASTFTFKSRRNGMHISASTHNLAADQNGTIKPTGNGSSFFYTPSNRPAADLSPRSSSPASSAHCSSDEEDSDDSDSLPPRSLSSSPAPPNISSSPTRTRTKIVAEGNFTVEEFADSDYEDWDSDDEDVIRPHQYEDAESDRAPSVKASTRNDLDARILSGFKNLHCEAGEEERELWLEKLRAEKRRRRRSSASVQKRTLSQSIGSDTDEEDLLPITFDGANEAGSSARRLRRKTLAGERTSLIFDDPPPRIDEEDEGPESVEEVVEIIQGDEDDEDSDGDRELRELPYWYIQEMDVDSDEE